MSSPSEAARNSKRLNKQSLNLLERRGVIVFDSGIGGFSILKEILSGPTGDVLYLADQANFPYGDKSDAWLESRLDEVAVWAQKFKPEAFVLACNTATVSAIPAIRARLVCPVVGVEPVIKPLAGFGKSLILSTQATVRSRRTRELMEQYGRNAVIETPSGLAYAIEHNDIDQVKTILTRIADKVKTEHIEAIGLSCTHYPLILPQMQELMPGVHFYDPSAAVVSQLRQLISSYDGTATVRFATTGQVVRFNEQIQQYLGLPAKAESVVI